MPVHCAVCRRRRGTFRSGSELHTWKRAALVLMVLPKEQIAAVGTRANSGPLVNGAETSVNDLRQNRSNQSPAGTASPANPIRANRSCSAPMEDKLFGNKYRVARDAEGSPLELWRSGSGITYRAEDIENVRQVALELVPSAPLKPAVRESLEAEANSAKQITHINIPAVYDFGFDADQMFYVMEPVEGITAGAWVAANGAMPGAAVLRVALQVLGALGAAAFHGIVHHAISPRNLLLVEGQTSADGWPLLKLLNLIGVAPAFWTSKKGATAFDSFASPEQLQDGRVDFRSEIYSLGCTLWFLLTGAPPFASLPAAVGPRPMEMVLELEKESELPKKANRLLLQMLAVDPNERPHDPLVLYQQLQECLLGLERRGDSGLTSAPVVAPPVAKIAPAPAGTTPAPVARQRRTFAAAPIAIAAVLIALATLAPGWPERFRPDRLLQGMARPKQLGIPIGVPEQSSAPVTAQLRPVMKEPPPSHQNTPVTASSDNGVTADEPPPLAPAKEKDRVAQVDATNGTTDSAPAESPGTLVAISKDSAEPQRSLPANTPEAPAEQTAATITEESAPLPPAEGPGKTFLTASDPNTQPLPPASNDSPAAPASATDAQLLGSGASKGVATARRSNSRQTKSAVKSTRSSKASAKKKSRVAQAGGAREPKPAHGTVRARFVGTTSDGQWIVDVPSSGPGVVSLPSGSAAGDSLPRRWHGLGVGSPPDSNAANRPADER